ncbi:hypothetical protein B0T22DRAFT_110197 [Podospora appendiculata]|uniref:Uncharacterized protein n=1 Tax=Podospora appendiculata TaxID=314037 RepID=A0AAE0XLJ6_9PEZI|nr:hypothetical protein B0T22DRAFT_110197 [Podospora appendiculata]
MYTRSNGTPVGADVSFMGAYEALLSIQANHIRRDIAQEIKEYEHHFGNLMRMAKSVHCKLSGMDMISAHFPTPELVDEARLMDVTLSFIEASNNILAYLEIVKKNTGLPSGGDSALETHVKNGQRVVSVLLQTYIAHMDAQYVPGKDVGLAYGRDIKLAGRHVLHKHFGSSNGFIVHDRAGGPHDHWHIDHLLHPLRRVPGTPWHKYFGNIQSDTNQFLPPNLFDGQASQQININMPVSTNFMRLSTGQEYGSHRTWFNMRPDREHLHPSVKEVCEICAP